MTENMKLWDLVFKTDPKDTKKASMKGGFKATAICAQSQIMKATEVLGPMGISFGAKNPHYELIGLSNDFHDQIMSYSATFWYEWQGNKGEFPIESDIDVWNYSNKYKSWSKANDMRKKLSTDALTKALSKLGFNADVFMGLFDDNKYVQEMKQEFQEPKKTPTLLSTSIAPDMPEETEMKKMFQLFKYLNMSRGDILKMCSDLSERQIKSSSDLKAKEVNHIIKCLKDLSEA